MTDLRYLLAIYMQAHRTGNSVPPHIDAEAIAALADGPAVPESREPASVTGQPSNEELLETLDKATATFPPRHPEAEGLNAVEYPLALELRKARAVLARWGNPAPQPPAEGEVGDRVAWLRRFAAVDWIADETADKLYAIADILSQHHPAPVPVPVSERLPAMVTDGLRVAGDCDEQGRCWAGTRVFVDTSGDRDIDYPPSWELREVRAQDDVWLPAHALPIPHQQQENTNG